LWSCEGQINTHLSFHTIRLVVQVRSSSCLKTEIKTDVNLISTFNGSISSIAPLISHTLACTHTHTHTHIYTHTHTHVVMCIRYRWLQHIKLRPLEDGLDDDHTHTHRERESKQV